MNHLVALFPYHSRTQLQECLNQAGGHIEQAVEVLFNVPVRAQSPPPRPPHIVHRHSSQTSGHPNAAKRQKNAPASSSNAVVDLTWSDDDDKVDKVEVVPRLGTMNYLPIFDPVNQYSAFDDSDDFPQPQNPTVCEGGSSIPSFEDFHLREQKRIEDQRLKEQQAEEQRRALVENFVTHAQMMFENISVPYLERLIAENRPKIASDEDLVDTCIETIFKTNGKYPRAKRKRDADDVGEDDDLGSENEEETGSSNQGSSSNYSSSRTKRDFHDCTIKLSATYMSNSATQLFQDFPFIAASSIRSVMDKFSYHYAPAFEYMSSLMTETQNPGDEKKKSKEGDVRLIANKNSRKLKPPTPLNQLDPDFRKELLWIRAKLEKEKAEIEEALAEEENLRVHTENNLLRECGCCFDDVPANRIAMCEDGHVFCLSCSRRGAEVELGYRRTVLKCMTAGCKAVFSDSEAVIFLPKPVFEGLMRARQQNELKMAGLDSLVECPFCSYAAIVENDEDKEFRCQGPKCHKVSCRLCRALTHIPLSCEEYKKELEKDNVLSVQHKVEEQMSQALIRECVKCKSRFFKTEGCNKMTCPQCHAIMCYVCKVQIKDYSHFDNAPAGQPSRSKRCRLWEDTVQRNNDEVKAAAQRTLEELKSQDPNLVAQFRLDIPK